MNDVELESWRAQWQAAALPPANLQDRVERETRMMRRVVVGEIAVTVAFGGGSVAWAVLSRRTDALVLAFGIWVFIVIAWAISHLLRRDAWSPASLTTTAFLDLSILRCRQRREAIVAQAILRAHPRVRSGVDLLPRTRARLGRCPLISRQRQCRLGLASYGGPRDRGWETASETHSRTRDADTPTREPRGRYPSVQRRRAMGIALN